MGGISAGILRMKKSETADQRCGNAPAGIVYALFAYLGWGAIPLYFKQVAAVDALEIIVHRILWSFVCTGLILLLFRRSAGLKSLWCRRRRFLSLGLSGGFIAVNWLIFAWAVVNNRVLETSLGYFINPLFSVVLGVVLLGERLRPWQLAAVVLAAAGVINLAVHEAGLPWVSLSLAFSFGMYGLLRKQINIDALTGLFVETCWLTPLALGYFVWLLHTDTNVFGGGEPRLSAWLMLAGPVTTAPLLFFAAGARRLNLSMLGFLQYLTPSLSFLLAVLVFNEPFGGVRLLTFLFIWAGLLLFSIDSLRAGRTPAGGRVVFRKRRLR
jgi:chloramphenicol-sensitive protein RarD